MTFLEEKSADVLDAEICAISENSNKIKIDIMA